MFTKGFDKYACEGDKITCEVDGFIVTARIVTDDTIDAPDERNEGFWPSQNEKDAGYVLPENFEAEQAKAERVMKAWKNGDWFYCGVVLSVSKPVDIKGRTQEEVIISDHAASLWGVECNYPDSDNSYLLEVANELLPEALNHARECLKQIAA